MSNLFTALSWDDMRSGEMRSQWPKFSLCDRISAPGCDGQTDGRTDKSNCVAQIMILLKCHRSFLSRRHLRVPWQRSVGLHGKTLTWRQFACRLFIRLLLTRAAWIHRASIVLRCFRLIFRSRYHLTLHWLAAFFLCLLLTYLAENATQLSARRAKSAERRSQ